MQEVIQQENCHACGGPDIPASGAYPAQSVAVMSYQELLKTCVMVARLAAETARFFRDIAVANGTYTLRHLLDDLFIFFSLIKIGLWMQR